MEADKEAELSLWLLWSVITVPSRQDWAKQGVVRLGRLRAARSKVHM
jgi:hypothetical protein